MDKKNQSSMLKDMLHDFGFAGYKTLMISLIRIDNIKLLSLFAMLGTLVENIVGLKPYTVLVLMILLLVELAVGISASLMRKEQFHVRRLQRFGLKFLIYFFILLLLNTFVKQYTGRPEEYVYSALHSFVVFYVIGVYSISILENTSYVLGGSKEINGLLKVFRVKLKEATNIEVKQTKHKKRKHEEHTSNT